MDLAIEIYNSKGQKIRHLYEGPLRPGEYQFRWDGLGDDGRRCSSGVYYGSIQGPAQRYTVKLLYLK